MKFSEPIGLLVQKKRLQFEQLDRAERSATEMQEALEPTLTRLGLVSEREMADAFSEALDLPIVGPPDLSGDLPILSGLSPTFLRQFRVVVLDRQDTSVVVAMANPLDDYAAQAIALFTGLPVQRKVATPTDIDAALDRHFANGVDQSATEETEGTGGSDLERLRDMASDAPVIRLVNSIVSRAVDARASDIHIEPAADRLVVRYRIDGVMREVDSPPLRLRDAIVSRIKIMARLNIAERRLPQDGRMSASVRGLEVDFRVATVPTVHGESVVIRVLDREQVQLDFAALGFDQAALDVLRPLLRMPNGILLVTGPTGSGKTTTLYAALSELNVPERKIMTIEDPVEYQLDRVNQVQVQPSIGLTFAWALRSFLRHNPNIVMVGEIRDLETAQVAVQVALTGHMILSTLHTNDAATGVTRLLDMGIEDYLIVSTVNAIMAQRLVRTLCVECRAPYAMPAELASRLGLPHDHTDILYQAAGCPACGGTGYRGRTTILEILPLTNAIRRLVLAHASASEILQTAIGEGMRTMQAHGMEKVLAGLTTIEEVLSVTKAV